MCVPTAIERPIEKEQFVRHVEGFVSQGLHGNNAVDIAAPAGTEVHATADGVVIAATFYGWNSGLGRYILIEHEGGAKSVYAHLDHITVAEGDTVVQGERIGTVGLTGKSTGYHLHFEIHGAMNPFTN